MFIDGEKGWFKSRAFFADLMEGFRGVVIEEDEIWGVDDGELHFCPMLVRTLACIEFSAAFEDEFFHADILAGLQDKSMLKSFGRNTVGN